MNTHRVLVRILGVIALIASAAWNQPAIADDVKVSPLIAEVAKLHESGVGEDVLVAYVKGTTEIPRPTADEVIFLKDKGISKDVLLALLSRSPKVMSESAASANGSGRILAKPRYEQSVRELPPAVAPAAPATQSAPTVVQVQPATVITAPPTVVYPAPRYYYDPWPVFSIGLGLGHWWHGGHHGWGHGHHGGHHGGHH